MPKSKTKKIELNPWSREIIAGSGAAPDMTLRYKGLGVKAEINLNVYSAFHLSQRLREALRKTTKEMRDVADYLDIELSKP